jgi:hypothetical protein
MRHRSKHGLLFLLLAVMALPLQAAAEGENSREVQAGLLTHVSQQVALRFAAAHPPLLRVLFAKREKASRSERRGAGTSRKVGDTVTN